MVKGSLQLLNWENARGSSYITLGSCNAEIQIWVSSLFQTKWGEQHQSATLLTFFLHIYQRSGGLCSRNGFLLSISSRRTQLRGSLDQSFVEKD